MRFALESKIKALGRHLGPGLCGKLQDFLQAQRPSGVFAIGGLQLPFSKEGPITLSSKGCGEKGQDGKKKKPHACHAMEGFPHVVHRRSLGVLDC
jgi:hypothetical protein